MYCKKCGAQNQDGEKFCMQCGANIMENPAPASVPTEAATTQTPKPKKKLPKWALIAIPVAVILLIILIVCLIINGNTVKMNKQYIDFEVEGYNGYGEVYAEIDWEAVSEKYGSKLKKAFNGGGMLGSMFEVDPVEVMSMLVDIELDYEGELKNGDTIKYKWVVADELYDLFDIEFKFKDGTYKVTGLEEIESVNIFDKITVTFNGYDGVGSVSAKSDGYGDVLYYYMDFDKTSDLKNGDVITLTLSENGVEYFFDEYEKAPSCVSMQYTVEGLEEPTSYNPFEHLELDLSGMNGFTTAKVIYSGGYLDADEFTISKHENLSNGEVVTVTISESVCKEYLESDGVKFTQTSKEFTVSDRNTYVTKLSDITEEQWNELKNIANNAHTENIASYHNTVTPKSHEYIGAHLLTAKDGDGSCLLLVYKETIHLKCQGYKYYGVFDMRYETFEKTVSMYRVYEFDFFATNAEGELSYIYDGNSGNYSVDSDLYSTRSGIGGTIEWEFTAMDTYETFYANWIEYNSSHSNNEDNID